MAGFSHLDSCRRALYQHQCPVSGSTICRQSARQRAMATRRRTCGRTAASCRPRSSPARLASAGACSLGWAPTTSSRTSRGWRRSSRRRRTWCFWASGAWRRSGDCAPGLFYHVMARAGPRNVGTRAILGLFADGFAYFPKRRRRRERAAAGARVLYSPQTFACWRCCSAWERHCAAQASLRRTQHCATPT